MAVDILFSLLNFAVLIGLFAYVFLRIFYPQFSQKIAADKEWRNALEAERNGCAARLAEVEDERERQEEMYRALVRKVTDWRQAVIEHEQQLKHEQEVHDEAVRMRAEKQAAALVAQRQWARVVPQAIAQARLELYDHFQSGEAGSCYVDQLVKNVGKSMREHHGDT